MEPRACARLLAAILTCTLICPWPGFGAENDAEALHEAWYPQVLEQSVPARIPGPFQSDSLVFYVVHHGGPLALTLQVNRPDPETADLGGIRYPHLVYWQLYDAEEILQEQDLQRFNTDAEKEYRRTMNLDTAPAGIYQVRVTKTPGNSMTFDLLSDPPCSLGIMPARSRLHSTTPEQFADVYVYAPPGSEEIRLQTYAAQARLSSLDGAPLGSSAEDGGRCRVTPGTVYALNVSFARSQSAFGISGMPPILCPDPATARSLRGSLEVAPDGQLLSHRFQLRMWQWMHRLTPEDLAVEPEDLAPLRQSWLADPRNAGLLGLGGPFNHVPKILRDQVVDRNSADYGGGIGATWLGPAYVIDAPFNPYRRRLPILNRLLLSEFKTFLRIQENGTFQADNWNTYCGGDGLGYNKRAFQFAYVAPHMEAESLRELWFEGISKPLHRWAFARVSCENQSAAFPAGLACLALGSGRTIYQELAQDFVANLFDPEMNRFYRTGYLQERYGPDATYQGLACAELAFYYRLSGDPNAKAGLQRIYSLLNHTVAPEPDGTLLGASNFSHRTSGSWVQKQYNGGVSLMAGDLPEAGIWNRNRGDTAAWNAARLKDIETGLNTHWDDAWYAENRRWAEGYAYHPWLAFFNTYLLPPEQILAGHWPAQSAEPFSRDMNGEFLFLRRPGYYAALYTGSTMSSWVKAGRKAEPHHAGWEMTDGVLRPVTGDARKTGWWPTQGLSMFWTPAAGSLILAHNWNVYTANIVRADLEENRVSWPDYWEFSSDLSSDNKTLQTRAQMVELPLDVARTYRFSDTSLEQTVHLEAREPLQTQRLVEQIPFLEKEGTRLLCQRNGRWQAFSEGQLDAAWIGTPPLPGLLLTCSEPVNVTLGPVSAHYAQRLGLLEIALPNRLVPAEPHTLQYTLQPAAAPPLPGP